ncbi:putative protein kinase [Trypanosoma rangeli]|uniref:Protein kinase domain-containing protein n=1 Tax=Trypanosoma rangeli TaxID=5698 RepID=A0A422NZ23_TRYRA|nr:putative protein kinase [Trypanosoma rangeli]RNF10694.1 putative protein kinase [Trypanosoma rangeli]|eukprot:RNF10694.1 putative protein kinase [Trypanosoma rangeli]
MGNQLAAATSVNVSDVSSVLALVAPLGGEHRYYFRSFHCAKLMDATNGATETLRSRHFYVSTTERRDTGATVRRPFQKSGGRDVVVKVFVRTLGDNLQKQLVEFCYDHLLGLHERMTNTQGADFTVMTMTSGYKENNSAEGGLCVSPPCNVLFYSRMEVRNDRFCMLERSYVAYSLSERLATRPYWNMGQRLFAGYQLLQGLVQLHEGWETVHGDLKTENVLVDTSGWLYMTDICPFKPGLLPANNPALFDYYYDTNETRICYLAPEKFMDDTLPFNTSNLNANGHTKAMDIFSAACVLAHIFTEEPLFSLSDTLSLRLMQTQQEREFMVQKVLAERGVSPNVGRMLLNMLCNLPATRPTARQLLEAFTPSVFPSYFGFIYHEILPPLLARPPDLQVQLLHSRLQDILEEVERHCSTTDATQSHSTLVKEAKQLSVQLLLPVILNASLHLITDGTFCRLISIIQMILPHCSSELQKDTLLPYVLHYVKMDRRCVVARILALRILSMICHSIPFSASDATIFDDLVLPCVEQLLKTDTTDVGLLVEVADQLPGILLRARTFLEHRQSLASANAWQSSFGEQLNTLLDRGWDTLRLLYKHPNTTVVVVTLRRTVDVVAFLGEERAQDDLIPFLTTVIASTIDVQRELYPQAILCHLYLQAPKLRTLRFFLEEGLKQTDVTCLVRIIESIAIIVEKKCLAVWDTMPLVHQVLPHIVSSNRWVSAAASRMLEKVACTHRVSDVWMYLTCAVLPLLRHPVPLSHISLFPTAVKLEMSHYIDAMEQMMRTMNAEARSLGGNTDSHERVLYRSAGHILPQYETPFGIARRSLRGLTSRVASVDVTFDSNVFKPDVAEGIWRDSCQNFTWNFFFRPTRREQKRVILRQRSLEDDGDASVALSHAPERQCVVGNLYQTRGVEEKGESSVPSVANVTWNAKELKPIASPWFTQTSHSGGIYCTSAARGGTLVTAGSCGEAVLWSLGLEGMDYSYRIQTNASRTSTFLFANFLREGMSPLLYMGGTDGEWCLFDVACNNIVLRRSLAGGTLTSACLLGDFVTLVTGALGGVYVMDSRVGKEVWQTTLPPAVGPPSGVSPLFLGSRAYGASVVTLTGGVALFDLRFQMLVQEHRLGNGGGCDEHGESSRASTRVMDNPNAILCVSPDTACSFLLENSNRPGLFLGTKAGTVHWMDLSTGETRTALQPTTIGQATRALLVQPKHSVVVTAGDDMWIRKWCLAAPNRSKTLVCPPFVSPVYAGTISGGIAETRSERHFTSVQPSHLHGPHSTNHGCVSGGVVPRQHEDAILSLCVVSNGNASYLASGSRDGTLTVWLNTE